MSSKLVSLLAGGGERALHGLKFCAAARNARRNHLGQPLDAQCSHGSGSGCAEEAGDSCSGRIRLGE